MTRFSDQYVDLALEVTALQIAEWRPHALATEEIAQIREEVQVVLACIMSTDRRTDPTDRRQLSQALAHLRKMRSSWGTLLTPGTVLPTGEDRLPSWATVQARLFSVRDWGFARQRRAVEQRTRQVTIAKRTRSYKDRCANRMATFYSADIAGIDKIFGI